MKPEDRRPHGTEGLRQRPDPCPALSGSFLHAKVEVRPTDTRAARALWLQQ